jgi:hypothetical protein
MHNGSILYTDTKKTNKEYLGVAGIRLGDLLRCLLVDAWILHLPCGGPSSSRMWQQQQQL